MVTAVLVGKIVVACGEVIGGIQLYCRARHRLESPGENINQLSAVIYTARDIPAEGVEVEYGSRRIEV